MSKTVPKRKRTPARTPEEQEQYMIGIATDLAEKQILDGTASSQVITHYLKLGSTEGRLSQDLTKSKIVNIDAKTEEVNSSREIQDLFKNAQNAARGYRTGEDYSHEEDEE